MIRFFIDSYGCKKNSVDAEILIALLQKEGFELCTSAKEAQLIVINSCGFIQSAKEESLNALFAMRNLYPKAKIIFAGCLAQRYATEFEDDLLEADAIFGNGDLSQITKVIQAIKQGNRIVLTPQQKGVFVCKRDTMLQYDSVAFVKLSEGCNNHCAFCAIPLIRGDLRSRTPDDVIIEIKDLLQKGVFEINLVAQDLASYGRDSNAKYNLNDILLQITRIPGDFWVRLLYIHPDNFDKNILSIIARDKRILPYFDIPFQAGSDKLLSLMGRKHTTKYYIDLVNDIRNTLSDSVIRTTFMTGFPGETQDCFEETLDFVNKIQCDWAGVFSYSKEEGTPSFDMKNQVPQKVALERKLQLEQIQTTITKRLLATRNGRDYDVLIEEVIAGEDGLAIGRAWFEAIEVDGNVVVQYNKNDDIARQAVKPGRLVLVHANKSSDFDISAVFIKPSELKASSPVNLNYMPQE